MPPSIHTRLHKRTVVQYIMPKFGNVVETFLISYLARVPTWQTCQLPFSITEGLITGDNAALYLIHILKIRITQSYEILIMSVSLISQSKQRISPKSFIETEKVG